MKISGDSRDGCLIMGTYLMLLKCTLKMVKWFKKKADLETNIREVAERL